MARKIIDEYGDIVQNRYYQLSSVNFSHFSAGGTAWLTYSKWHGTAVVAAFEAGSRRDPQQWLLALTREAFADHYLTGSFSADHVRTPRMMIKDWYALMFPGDSEPLVRYMSLCRARTRAEHLTWASILGTHALPPRLSAHDPVVRLAGAARPQRRLQGC